MFEEVTKLAEDRGGTVSENFSALLNVFGPL